MATVSLRECRFVKAWLTQCRHRGLELESCDLSQANLLHTPLKGLDLTSCRLDEVSLAAEDLAGSTMNIYQAAQFARLLGIRVRTE